MADEGDDLAETFVARAMYALAAACEPPALRPDCPFSVHVAGDVRTCRQQCFDVLTAHGIEPPGPELVPLPVPRDRADPRAFDASERYMRERGRHLRRWAVSSLMWALRQHVTRTPVGVAGPGDPERETALCLAELARRGFDVEEVVRLGMGEEIVSAVIVMAFLPTPSGSAMSASVAKPLASTALWSTDDRTGWVELLDQLIAGEDPDAGLRGDQLPFVHDGPAVGLFERRVEAALRGSFHKRVAAWVAVAPLDEIVRWQAPTAERFGTYAAPLAAPDRADAARWLVERFTEPYYDRWAVKSLHLEFQWTRGGEPAPCDEAYMDENEPRMKELADTIAVAATTIPLGHERHLALLKGKAIELLVAGERSAAAVVLDTSRQLDPSLPEPHNDYAFCVLPDDPTSALHALEQARQLGYDRTVGLGNRALCLAMLGRPAEALALARRVIDHYPDEDWAPSFLWDPVGALRGEDVNLLVNVSPRDYVLNLGVAIAEHAGDDASRARWTAARDRLTRGPEAA